MLNEANDNAINKAVFILRKMSEDEKMQEEARIRERALHDEASFIQDALDEGMARGRAEGRAEGMAKGMAKGIEKERIRIMQNLKSAGMSSEQIDAILSM